MASTLPPAATTACPASSGPSAALTAKPRSASALATADSATAPERAGARQQIGRHLVRPTHAQSLGLEELDHPRQYRIVAAGEQAQDLRQARDEAQVRAHGLEIGPPHGAGDHHLAAAFAAQDRHNAADLAPAYPGVGEAPDLGVGLAGDADDVHLAAAGCRALRDHQRKPPSACKNAEPRHGIDRSGARTGAISGPRSAEATGAAQLTARREACTRRACRPRA